MMRCITGLLCALLVVASCVPRTLSAQSFAPGPDRDKQEAASTTGMKFGMGETLRGRFSAPVDSVELEARLAELRRQYEPFLRSLPPPPGQDHPPKPARTALPRGWRFTYEATKTPPREGIPAAPDWHAADFDDSAWERTTVPEWRYRTREGGDTARNPDRIAQWKNSETTADTICWYRTRFRAAKPDAGRRIWLCFDGVEWEAQVWLNGEYLGNHRVYYEPFRFDVTDRIAKSNTLAVRVISGRKYGQPMTYWGVFPDIRAKQQRYTPDPNDSIPGNLPIGYHAGCGFGIHRDVYLEETGPTRIDAVFARNDLTDGNARVKIELDRSSRDASDVRVEIMPENFEGRSYSGSGRCESGTLSLKVPMPESSLWSPEQPYLYRCRVTAAGSDSRDVLFGCRSFQLVNRDDDRHRAGMFLLNGRPIFLRGTNIQGLNVYAYWGQKDKLVNALLLLKAGNFNAVRSCQHVEFPEVLEMMDRIGIMSEQDQGGGYRGSLDMGIRREQHIHTGTVLARQTYNHPGVILLCFGNEHDFPTEPIVRAALAVDPQRIFKPISGRISHSHKPWDLPADLRAHAVDDSHPYSGWYGGIRPQTWRNVHISKPARLITLGEFGAEALDAYETMRDHYPPQFAPPPATSDTLWAACQVRKDDLKQIIGLGRKPTNLGQYIEASQNYQEAMLADKVIGMRLSPRAVGGYFQFHFLDAIPVFWPKSIVSHDHRPKKAYYQLAQINQPVVPLPQLEGARPDAVTLWVANDLVEPLKQATLRWKISAEGRSLATGETVVDVPALDAVKGPRIELAQQTATIPAFDLSLTLQDSQGATISHYQRRVRCVPDSILQSTGQTKNPFKP